MKAKSLILGALALGLLAGAAGSRTIPTDPVARATDTMAELPETPLLRYPGEGDAQVALPDHYPLETGAGRVEVGDLIWHGERAGQQEDFRVAALTE